MHQAYPSREVADTETIQQSKNWLGAHAEDAGGFFMELHTGAPHEPYYPEAQDAQKFAGEQVPRSGSFNEADVSDKANLTVRNAPPLCSTSVPNGSTSSCYRADGTLKTTYAQKDPVCNGLPELSIQCQDVRWRETLRDLQKVDRAIGDYKAILQNHGEWANTYVVYYTDNGLHLGQRRLPYGKQQPYEHAVNPFPLFVRGPGIPADTARGQLVANIDLAPTYAYMTGGQANIPAFVEGRNILNLAKGTAPGWPRSRIGIERLNMSPTWRGIRTPTEKFVMFEGGGREYYNLINDPGELNNTWGSLSQAKKDALVAQANALSNCSGAGCRTSDR
ncbi:MAG: sulfatase-like hydrolase/transferase [Chloroflexota bacterium]|nr:sulfatase-like hydrolase/transferase [Chloroflexota bacterium]